MFNKLAGNENVKQTLRHLLRNSRVPNSLLFAGDEGVGKKQFALELAKAFVCLEPNDFEACGVCAACRRADVVAFPTSDKADDYKKVFFSSHPDIGFVIGLKRNIYVDAIRELEREANFRPFESRARFFIVDDADKMNDPAANALLKTLEEPPATSHLFLITSRPDSLLPTIRSRCQTLRFAPVASDEIEQFLINDRAFTRDEARLAARLSRGSIGRALSINVEQFRGKREKMLEVLTKTILTGDRAALLRISETMHDQKNPAVFDQNIDILQSLIHDVWTLCVGGEASSIVNSDVSETLSRFVPRANSAELRSWINAIDTIRENLAVNINRKVAADALFVTMSA